MGPLCVGAMGSIVHNSKLPKTSTQGVYRLMNYNSPPKHYIIYKTSDPGCLYSVQWHVATINYAIGSGNNELMNTVSLMRSGGRPFCFVTLNIQGGMKRDCTDCIMIID